MDKLIISDLHDEQVVVLREANGERFVPFLTGLTDVAVLNWILHGLKTPRPQTFEAWLSSLAACGASVQSACIHDLRDQVYLAEVRLARSPDHSPTAITAVPIAAPQKAGLVEVDMRPSDALTLALQAGVPIFVRDWILSEVTSLGLTLPASWAAS